LKPSRSATSARPTPSSTAELGCPRCKAGVLIAGNRGWGCDRWRNGCRFVVWFEIAGRKLTTKQLRDLIATGKTRQATFFTERGAEVTGRLVLDVAAREASVRFEPG
ncbi:MAG: hypothetical protein M3619_28680, partial [Myxococcota bacterium]|nr:hypothetical protein [Myxococcota bacterium]